MGLHPTKTRIALLADVDAGRVFRDAIGDSYIAGGRKVTAAIVEMARADWVKLDSAPPGDFRGSDHWRVTAGGREVLGSAPLPGELVCATYSQPGSHELMIRRVPDGGTYVYWLYVNGARAYGPYWRGDDAYDRLKQLGGRP